MFETKVIRYRPVSRSIVKKAELLERKHDLSGLTYDHIRYLEPKEVYANQDGAHFLYDGEWVQFQRDHPRP
jgi:hypothetical protein